MISCRWTQCFEPMPWTKTDCEAFIVSLVPAPALLSSLLATSTVSTAATAATSACNTASPVIQNGGFESGSLSPWVATGTVDSQSSGSVVSGGSSYFAGSGSSYSGGNYAFSANLQTPNSPYGNGAVTQTLTQTLNTCPGTYYTITADYNFLRIGGTCSFTYGSIVVKSPPSATGVWQRMTSTFVAITYADVVSFTLTCSTPGTIEVDSVNITKITAS